MGTAFRCFIVIVGVTLWLTFAITDVEGSLSRRRNGAGRLPATVTHWFQANLNETPYKECESRESLGRVTKVEVSGCNGDPCELHAGSSATFNLGLVPSFNITRLHAVVHGVIGGVPIPFHIPHPNACDGCGLACPLIAGHSYSYKTIIPVRTTYPRINVKVKWELISESGKDLCVLIPAKIV